MVKLQVLVRRFGMVHSKSHKVGGVMSPLPVALWGMVFRTSPTGSTSDLWAAEPDGTQSTLRAQESLRTFHTPLSLLVQLSFSSSFVQAEVSNPLEKWTLKGAAPAYVGGSERRFQRRSTPYLFLLVTVPLLHFHANFEC